MAKKVSFLQDHYNQFRRAGGDHVEYIVYNDFDDDIGLCEKLRKTYEEMFPTKKEPQRQPLGNLETTS